MLCIITNKVAKYKKIGSVTLIDVRSTKESLSHLYISFFFLTSMLVLTGIGLAFGVMVEAKYFITDQMYVA